MTGSLPSVVHDAIVRYPTTEFASVSGAGIPIDTPLLCFAGDTTVDVTTGLAYPAKAERARRRPKVGLLLEPPGGPMVLVAALATVRDSNIEANARRYAREPLARSTCGEMEWAIAREAVWYWARIWIECTPMKVWWWPPDLDPGDEPESWTAPPGTEAPPSDPGPTQPLTVAPPWKTHPWQELAAEVVNTNVAPHLTMLNSEGWPLPLRLDHATVTGDGFELPRPAWTPWVLDGAASLCFQGRRTFVGRCFDNGDHLSLIVERALPTHPFVEDQTEVIRPQPETRKKLLGRLEAELHRRGQTLFALPDEESL